MMRSVISVAAVWVVGVVCAAGAAWGGGVDGEIATRVKAEVEEGRHPSLAVAVVRAGGDVELFAHGMADVERGVQATPDTIYRIGSVSKVFTATLLGILRDEGVVRLDDRVAAHLPEGVIGESVVRGGREMTLRDLAMHTSGLPRMPGNTSGGPEDPYAGYTREALLDALRRLSPSARVGEEVAYSNLGSATLGLALERASGTTYEELLRERIFVPLGMADSGIELEGARRERLATPYREGSPWAEAVDWDLGAMAPAGAVAASVRDMAKFLAMQLERGEGGVVRRGTLEELRTPQRVFAEWRQAMGLGWHVERNEEVGDVVWHNGGMAGFRSYVGFSVRHGVGVVALSNCGRSVDELGRWALRRAIEEKKGEAAAAAAEGGEGGEGAVDERVRAAAEGLKGLLVKAPAEEGIRTLFHPEFLARVPEERVKGLFGSLTAAHGECAAVARIGPARTPGRHEVWFRFEDGTERRCEIAVDGGEPARIVLLLFPPG